eukprot:gene12249-12386_t
MNSPEKPKLKSIEEVLPSADLLAHYKQRIDQFEQERDELLRAVDRCAVHQDEVHRLQWENRKRADEIRELQKALSDAQQFLFEERQRLLLLQAENDELKLQEVQDRQRIQQLLAMTQPIEQTIHLKQVENLGRQVVKLEETLRLTTRDYILDSKTREYVDKFREQVRSRDEELINLASLHTATKAAADKRIADLEARVTKLLEANRQLELRRQLDVDGWTADVTSLRKTLAAVDRKLLQMRLIERLEDDERLDALLDQLEKDQRPKPGKLAGLDQSMQQEGASSHAGDSQAEDLDAEVETVASSIFTGCSGSVKSGLAAELREVRAQLERLENQAESKARRALAGLPM